MSDKVDPLAEMVKERWEKGDRHLRKARRDYQLNLAFYAGQQWVWWDQGKSAVQALPQHFFDSERVRLTINKIEPRIDNLIGVLCERDLVFEGDPNEADDSAIAGSRLAESILESVRVSNDWEAVREENLINTLLGGTAAVALEWDTSLGDELWDEDKGAKVGTGDVALVPLSLAEFTLEPGSRRTGNANYWVGAYAMPPAQVKDRYGLSWDPEPDAKASSTSTIGQEDSAKDLAIVHVMYERPNRKAKEGRMVAICNETTMLDEKWPFPFEDRLNIAVFRQGRFPMRWYGKTFVTASRPVQVAYNAVRSNIVEHIKLAGNARLWVPKGALDDVQILTDEPGELVEYWADAGKPQYETPASLQRSTLEECDRLEKELDDILHSHDVSRGVAPGDRNSGTALAILAEKNNTPLGPLSRDQARGWASLASMVLELYEGKVTETRSAVVMSRMGVPQKRKWSGQDLRGQTAVRVPLDATSPHTRAQMFAMLQNLQQVSPVAFQSIPPQKLVKLMGMSSSRELVEAMDAGVARAHRENDLMSAGQPRSVAPWDNHAVHIAEHNEFRNSQAYDQLDADIQEFFELHNQAHEQYAQEEIQQQAAANAIQPGLGALPQSHDPLGSAVPPPVSQQQQMMNTPGANQ